METYRGYTLDICFEYKDGKVDGSYYHENDESARMIYRQTVAEVKDEIDTLIYEGMTIRVVRPIDSHRYTITKFDWLDKALEFAAKVNGEIKILYNGQEHTIDTI